MSVTELVQKHNLYTQVADLFREYHQKVQPITWKYAYVLALEQIPEDSPAYAAFQEELKPEWQKLGMRIRKLARKVDKNGKG